MADSYLFIAIDFGTAYTGYCFKIKGTAQMRMPRWGEEHGFDTCKTPTCILFDEKKEFKEFGYDALMTYTTMSENEAKKIYLFENFKMHLHNQEIHRDLMLTAKNGLEMKAMKVFSESIKYIKDHALKKISQHTKGKKYMASDATWVLTVPAIWSAAAKQFMREAATQAGLVTEENSDKLMISLEPEAASVYCKQLPSDGFIGEGLGKADALDQKPGTRYMVVDCGGGTIDITVHQVLRGGRLKEIYKVSGNNMGGQTVDRNFISFLRQLFSDEIFDEYEMQFPSELQTLMYRFTNFKRYDGDVDIECPHNLTELAQKKQDITAYFKRVLGAEWDQGKIKLSQSTLRSFYNDSLSGIETNIENILQHLSDNLHYIMLVGGFAQSKILYNFVQQKFGSRCKVICPADPQSAVLKGAVTFGTSPKIVASRISLYTYGISECRIFDASIHKGKSTFQNKNGIVFCNVCFNCLVRRDESVDCDEVRTFLFLPIEQDQTEMQFDFYRTEEQDAQFLDESGMEMIGTFSVPMPSIQWGLERPVIVQVNFGHTEMQATARDEASGETSSVRLNFMTK